MSKTKTLSDEIDAILADAQKGDPITRQRARTLVYETFPDFGANAAERERFFHQIEVFLNTRLIQS